MINFKDYLVGLGFILVLAIFLLQKIRVYYRKRKEKLAAKNKKKQRRKKRKI